MAWQFQRLKIPEVILVQGALFKDPRGFFMETYKKSVFADHGIPVVFVQDNLSHSLHGVLRGLHYQMNPKAQDKLILVLKGQIFDVAVDIRKGSPSYGDWVGVCLSAEGHQMLFVPAGFAHGFCVLSEEADVLYKVTQEYAPELSRGVLWNDPEINIRWPVKGPTLSLGDARLPLLQQADNNFVYDEAGL